MTTFVLLTNKCWHDQLFDELIEHIPARWIRIETKEEFVPEYLTDINPEKIFIPHWSHIIPETIFKNFECVVFHMTDLPYGRGGSPLQNLIVNGHTETKLSALKVSSGIDEGPIYLKKDLSLEGSARQIFSRASDLIKEMIIEIVETSPIPKKQVGKPLSFRRRKPEQSNIVHVDSLHSVYDYIRMLDADGYTHAFIESQYFKFEFTNADFADPENITANVRITKK